MRRSVEDSWRYLESQGETMPRDPSGRPFVPPTMPSYGDEERGFSFFRTRAEGRRLQQSQPAADVLRTVSASACVVRQHRPVRVPDALERLRGVRLLDIRPVRGRATSRGPPAVIV